MGKNNNSPNDWDNLLGSAEYLSDCGVITKKRVSCAKKWTTGYQQYLNIGSGQGFIEKVFSSDIKNEIVNWTALDISSTGLKKIKLSFPKVNCVKGSILKLPFPDSIFEVVICMEVIEHINKEDAIRAYSEMRRVGINNSMYLVSVPIFEPTSLINHPVGHNRKYTPSVISRELLDNGFRIIKSNYLYAFQSGYLLKSTISKYLNTRRPSVVMFLCQKF